MAINKKLIYFNDTLANFKSSANGLNGQTTKDANGNVGNIPFASIVFTNDGFIWTHCKEFNGNNTSAVTSINGKTGAVTLNLDDIADGSTRKLSNYLPLSGGMVATLTVTGAATFSQAINGSILGNAATASRLENARTITIGSLSNSFDGSANISYSLASMGAFASSSFTLANIKSTLGISDWALAGSKPSYNLDEISDGTTYHRKYPYGFNGQQNNNNWLGVSGLTLLTAWQDTTRGGEVGFWTNGSGQMYVAVDGFFYLRRDFNSVSRAQRVLDEYDISHTKWGDADTLDSLNSSDFVQIAGSQTISGNKSFSGSTSIDDATIGNLVVTGGASFALTINGNIATANKVNHTLTFTGYSTGTFDGSADKSIAIPSNTNQLTNGAGFITASSNITGTAAGITGYTFKSGITNTSNSGWTNTSTDDKIIPTMNFIAYWNGAYNSGGSSNLTYCCKGAFGTATTHAHTDYVTSITYDSTNKKLQLSKGGGAATDIVTFGSNAFNSTAYLPLSGNSTSSPITGIIYIDNVSGPYINSDNTDLDVWHVVGNSGSWSSQYGFNLQYKGSDSGNNNDLILWAHNETGTHAEVYRVHQNGTFIFKSTPYVGSNTVMLSNHAANGITSTDISNWNSVYTWLTTTTSDTDTTINKWHELETFLTSITESDTLSGLLASRVAKSGDTMTGALTTPGLTVTGASSFSLAINGSILGNAATASRLLNARNIAISGAVTGNANFDGSGNITISTSVNHTHAYFPYQYIWGDSLTSAVNLNTITDSLKFVTVSWSYSGYLNVTNSPWSSSAGNVFHLGGQYPMQIASFYNTSTDVYIRTYYSGNGWKDWKKIAFAGEAQPANGGNADTLNGLESGVINGSVSVFVPWPGNQTMKDEGLMPSEYGTSGYGYPDEVYLKSICKWAIAHYTNQGDVTLIGSIAPNSSGTCILHLYSSSGRDSSTLLPRYCSGTYTVLSGYIYNFGTIDYNWYYRQVSAGYASSAGSASSATQLQTSRSIWGQSFDGTGDVYGDMSNVGWINSVVSIGYQGNARLYIQGVSDNLDYLKMNVSDSNATHRHLILQDYGGNIAIGTTSPETKLDVNGIQQIYARGLDNSAFKDLLLLKAQHSSEPSADAWDASYPTFGIGFRRYWTSGNDPYGETTCAGIYATESASWRGGLVFRTKNNQTQGGTHDISALRLAPSGFAVFENNNLWLTPARLQIGRPDSTAYTDRACIGVTDGNLHIDPYSGHSLFLNYYNHATTYFGGSSYYISSDGSYYNGTAAAAGDADTVDTYHASDFVYRKNSTNVYNFIGSSQYSSSGWYKVTFPHANTTTDVSTYWFMLSMDVIFGGSYNYGPNGKVRLSYYFSRAVNSYATSVGNVYGVAFGNDLGPIRICYDPNDSGYMYVYNGGLYYATIAIKNLTITDNGQQYEYLNTVIEPCSAPSGVTDVTINKIYSNAGGGMLLNGSPLIHSSNIGWEWSSGVTYDPHTRRFTWSKSTNDWNALFYSRDGYFDDIGISFKPGQTGSYVMVGLNTDPTSNASYSSIDYCWYCTGGGTVQIYESGSYIGEYGAYSVGDEFTIIYSAKQIKYYWNGVVKRTVNRNIGSKLYADASFYNTSGYIDEVRYERMTHNNTISGIDNTAANALLHSGLYRADNASGDTWIFADDLDLGRWGIYHDLANNNIDFYGNGVVLARVGLYNGGFYSKYNITTDSNIIAAGDIRATGADVYIGSQSGSQCHQQYDATNKCLKFIFD